MTKRRSNGEGSYYLMKYKIAGHGKAIIEMSMAQIREKR